MSHEVDRRAVLAGASSLAVLAGCERVVSRVSDRLSPLVPGRVALPRTAELEHAAHVLSRLGFGPRPGDVEAVAAMGVHTWFSRQLAWRDIPDKVAGLRCRRFESVAAPAPMAFEYRPRVLRDELARHAVLLATYTERQLHEVMVGVWNDHLNIDINKGSCLALKATDEREVIRPHALGDFPALVRASVTSAAMLVYLDGAASSGRPGRIPNENHARELMELHTLGVHGGYTQRDVEEAARCLTGWRVREGLGRGTVYFDAAEHDDGAKRVLGVDIPSGLGEGDVDRLVDILCRHPATATHLATRLTRRLVSDRPDPSLVEAVAAAFTSSGGSIPAMLATIVSSEAFAASRKAKVKTPFRFVVSALRALGADTHAHPELVSALGRMGNPVFEYPTPEGYPDDADAQSGSLLWRWTLAMLVPAGGLRTVAVPLDELDRALAHGEPDVTTRWAEHLLGGRVGPAVRARLDAAVDALGSSSLADRVGLILASPDFMHH